jgi:hypothetical protein
VYGRKDVAHSRLTEITGDICESCACLSFCLQRDWGPLRICVLKKSLSWWRMCTNFARLVCSSPIFDQLSKEVHKFQCTSLSQ